MIANINRFPKIDVTKIAEIFFKRTITMESKGCKNLLVEPFYGGSHKQLIDLLASEMDCCELYTLPAKKWHWKARTSALHFSQVLPVSPDHRTIFASSVLNLAELVALRPDIARLNKIVYVHENQLCYPVRVQKDRDFQYGYNQILTCLVADTVVFNSHYNMESFLSAINSFLKKIRDHRPKKLDEEIRPKCRVIYFPLEFPDLSVKTPQNDVNDISGLTGQVSDFCIDSQTPEHYIPNPVCGRSELKNSSNVPLYYSTTSNHPETRLPISSSQPNRVLHVVWAHRWEHDKDPETLFKVLFDLHDNGSEFKLSVLGERFTETPEIFVEAKEKLKDHILHWGYLDNKLQYYQVLQQADVSVSTALHEFYGVAMLESVYFGCFPLCPNRLVYPEIFPEQCLYNTPNQLYKRLKNMCSKPDSVAAKLPQICMEKYLWSNLKPDFINLFSIP